MKAKLFTSISIIFMSVFVLFAVSCSNTNTVNYSITFVTNSDAIIEPIIAYEGQAILAPADPIREGYRFDGWFSNEELFVFNFMTNQNIELSAKWSKYYNITFDTTGGTEIPPLQIAEGDEISISDIPALSHYIFGGWSYLGEDFDLNTMPSNNLLLLAIWEPASTITYEARVYDRYLDEYVDISMDALVGISGTEISAPEAPKYSEYKFLSWQLDGNDYTFDTMPETDITLTANWLQLSNLPTLFIDLYDSNNNIIPIDNITRETYVSSKITLENTINDYLIEDANALFKGRGNGSWVDSGDKRGYRIKFEDKQSILGSNNSKHWVILACANFDDITMYRNKLAFNMADEIFTNIEYVTSAEWVDVYFNGVYHGVYLICEQIRVDEDRVDIESEYGVLDTGYLIEYDAYATGVAGVDYFRVDGMRYPFTVKSPDPEEYLENGFTLDQYKEQVQYIQSMVQSMVSAVMSNDFATFTEFADANSFVDIYILQELFKNIDAGYSSFYIYREPGGKLFAGPPWDFDATCASSPTRGNSAPQGIYVGLSVQAFSSKTANELLIKLYANPDFKNLVIDRWIEISPGIQSYINQTLTDEMIQTYEFAIGRNFVRWPTPFGWGTPVTQETAEANWTTNIGILKQWFTNRITWLNGEWSHE